MNFLISDYLQATHNRALRLLWSFIMVSGIPNLLTLPKPPISIEARIYDETARWKRVAKKLKENWHLLFTGKAEAFRDRTNELYIVTTKNLDAYAICCDRNCRLFRRYIETNLGKLDQTLIKYFVDYLKKREDDFIPLKDQLDIYKRPLPLQLEDVRFKIERVQSLIRKHIIRDAESDAESEVLEESDSPTTKFPSLADRDIDRIHEVASVMPSSPSHSPATSMEFCNGDSEPASERVPEVEPSARNMAVKRKGAGSPRSDEDSNGKSARSKPAPIILRRKAARKIEVQGPKSAAAAGAEDLSTQVFMKTAKVLPSVLSMTGKLGRKLVVDEVDFA